MTTNKKGTTALAVDPAHSDAVPEGETISAKERNARLARDIQDAQTRLNEATEVGDDVAVRRATRRLDDAKAALYEANIGLADGWAKRFRRDGDWQTAMDYRDAAREGLWEAIACWNSDKGSLGNWAWPRIKKALFGEVVNNEHHLSTHAFQYRPRILAAVETLREAGEMLTDDRIALECELPVSLVTHVRRIESLGSDLSLDAPAGKDNDGGTLGEIIGEILADSIVEELPIERQRTLFAGCTMAELWVTLRTLGLDGAPKETIQVVGSTLGRSRETPRKYARNAERMIAKAAQGELTAADLKRAGTSPTGISATSAAGAVAPVAPVPAPEQAPKDDPRRQDSLLDSLNEA